VEPLIPPRPAGRAPGGRPRLEDRQAVEGILFVLTTGIGWAKLPGELGFGSGWTAWRRLREWQAAGVWDRLHRAVLDELNRRQLLDWSRAVLDSASVRAKRGVR
jgi:transposase